ncbi:MAG: HEAT repeat domain-containing protein [Planctomycetaceae bacterium]|nr:HEAT repeat domain-containing protein [Planctomycetaceae bacterium]
MIHRQYLRIMKDWKEMRAFLMMTLLFLGLICWLGAGENWGTTVVLAARDAPESSKPNRLDPLVNLLLEISEPNVQVDVLKGIAQAVKGQRDLPMPTRWPEVSRKLSKSNNSEVRQFVRTLSLTFGDRETMDALRELIADKNSSIQERQKAIESLAQIRDPKLLPVLMTLLDSESLSESALKGLAAYDSSEIPMSILKKYSDFKPSQRQAALHTLVSRKSYAVALLNALEQKHVPPQDLSTYLVRQIAAFDDKQLNDKLRKTWGQFRPTSADKTRQIQALKSQLTEANLKKADPALGRVVFAKTCAGCHVLFDEGRLVGPNLTGSQRYNLDYVLENVFDPSAVVGRDYRLTTVATSDGRVLTGIVTEETNESLTLKTPKDDVILTKREIEDRKQSKLSMMPEGLFEKLTEIEIRNLVVYLASPSQVPLPDDQDSPNQ